MNANVVIDDFMDLKDNNHVYKKGSLFPFENRVVEENRIEELSSSKNKRNKKLIKQVKLNKLTEKQLLEYATILGIDIRKTILTVIMETINTDSANIDSEQEDENPDDEANENVSDKQTDDGANENTSGENIDIQESNKEKINE